MGSTVERHTHLHIDEGVNDFLTDHHSINIEYAKYMGLSLIALGLVGIPFVGESWLFFTLTQLQCTGHLLSGMLLVASVIVFDGSYARLINQIIGPFCMVIAAYGLSAMTPVTSLFNLNNAEIIFYMLLGLMTAIIGWGSDFKHWWV